MPKAVVAALPTRRVRVRIGDESFDATLGAYGGRTFLGLRKALLTALGVGAGDRVHVELEPGEPPAEPEIDPAPLTCTELTDALTADDALASAWGLLPDEHRTEYGRWISGGADAEVRRARVARARHRLLA